MLQIRMYFLRTAEAGHSVETLKPSEMAILLSHGKEILPALVHSSARQGDPSKEGGFIQLAPVRKQAVEFFFPLPEGVKHSEDIQWFRLRWTLHYDGGKTETQVTRFDRQDSRPQQGAEMFPWDSDYPYDESPVLPPGWQEVPWYFWEPFPGIWY